MRISSRYARYMAAAHPPIRTIGLLLAMLLTSCATPPSLPPNVPPAPTAIPFIQLNNLPRQGSITTLGYLLITTDGAVLAPAAGFTTAVPAALGEIADQIWCGQCPDLAEAGSFATTAGVRHAIVLVAGTLDPPGSYGPAGIYPRQLQNTRLTVMNPEETNIESLRKRAGFYQQRVVRVVGWLLLSSGSAVLVDTLNQGGVPEPGAISLKIRHLTEDAALIAGLQATESGSVRYGQVQVEGYMQDGALIPLALRIVRR